MKENTMKLILSDDLLLEFLEFLSQHGHDEDILLTSEDSLQKSGTDTSDNLKVKIPQLLKQLGISPKLKGYAYIKAALEITLEDSQSILAITKNIYPEIALKYHTSPSNVERAMRHAICGLWNTDNKDIYQQITMSGFCPKPSNGQFLAKLTEYLLMRSSLFPSTQSPQDQSSVV